MLLLTRGLGLGSRSCFKHGFAQASRFNSTGGQKSALNWVEYFKLKKQSNYINMFASGFTTILGGLVTLNYLGNVEVDVEKPIMGLDPFMVFGGCVFVGAGAGFLMGPFLGRPLFGLWNKKIINEFKIKDQQFLLRIKEKRVNPASQSFSNPVPDYYGERIYSLNSYKQWLRDCNAFRRKSQEFL